MPGSKKLFAIYNQKCKIIEVQAAQPTHKPKWPNFGRSISPGQTLPGVKISLWKFYRPISSYLCDTDWRFMLSNGKNKPNNQIDFFNSCFCALIFQYLRFVMFLNPTRQEGFQITSFGFCS